MSDDETIVRERLDRLFDADERRGGDVPAMSGVRPRRPTADPWEYAGSGSPPRGGAGGDGRGLATVAGPTGGGQAGGTAGGELDGTARRGVDRDGRPADPEVDARAEWGVDWEDDSRRRTAAGAGEDAESDGAGPGRLSGPDGSGPGRLSGPDGAGPRRLSGPGAFDPGRRGVRALAVVAAVVVLVAAGWAWLSRPHSEPVPEAPTAATPLVSGSLDPGVGPSPAELVVAVAGKVRRPGLVRLPAGARVADALAAAGGAQPGVDMASLNLARRVADGELILVGVTPAPGAAGPVGDGSSSATGIGPAGKVNLNTATAAQLDALPGVGPVLAQRIVDHRERSGGFRAVGDLRQVTGIGDARYEDLKDLVTV